MTFYVILHISFSLSVLLESMITHYLCGLCQYMYRILWVLHDPTILNDICIVRFAQHPRYIQSSMISKISIFVDFYNSYIGQYWIERHIDWREHLHQFSHSHKHLLFSWRAEKAFAPQLLERYFERPFVVATHCSRYHQILSVWNIACSNCKKGSLYYGFVQPVEGKKKQLIYWQILRGEDRMLH